MEKTIPRHTGVPSFFRYGCDEARKGGSNTYRNAAWHLAIHLNDQIPDDIDFDGWQEYVEELERACDERDDLKIWLWFKRHYPICMELVPDGQQKQFVDGVLDAHDAGRIT